MSLNILLNPLRCCRSRFTVSNYYCVATQSRQYARNSNSSSKNESLEKTVIGHSTVVVQQGIDIQELPVIIKKIGQEDLANLCSNPIQSEESQAISSVGFDADSFAQATAISEGLSTEATRAICEQIEKCQSTLNVLGICDALANDLTGEIAISAFEQIVAIESNLGSKNFEFLRKIDQSSDTYDKIIGQMCCRIDTRTLQELMLRADRLKLPKTLDRVCNELLVRSSECCLSIVEICESIKACIKCEKRDVAEKFWSGIADQEELINAQNIKFIYHILHKLKVSRRMVIGVLERRITEVFAELSPAAVRELMMGLQFCLTSNAPPRTMKCISRWLNTNTQALDETSLLSILSSFSAMSYTDAEIEKALERYMKARATQTKFPQLMVIIMRHIKQFRVMNPFILNGCSEYIVANVDHIQFDHVQDLIYPFGLFNYDPVNSAAFWPAVEQLLNKHFNKIFPTHFISLLLSFCYLGKLPTQFSARIFDTEFLNTLLSLTPIDELPKVRNDLLLFDSAMTLECDAYNGPRLSTSVDPSPSELQPENRIGRLLSDISNELVDIAGGENCLTKSAMADGLPSHRLYAIDVLFHPPGLTQFWKFNPITDRNVYVAALVHLPEHYDQTGKYLNGEQTMRIRHLRSVGLKVVSINYETTAKLRELPKQLHQYLVAQVKKALPPIEATDTLS